jgi:hypothetical protein
MHVERITFRQIAAIAAISVGMSASSPAQVTQEQRITPTPRLTSQIFGLDLDFDGTTIAVGASFESQPATSAGAVYLFQRPAGTWVQRLRLHGPTPQSGDYFGLGVAIEGSTLLASAGGRTSNGVSDAGELYAYQYDGNTWQLVDTIEPSNPIIDGSFGDPIALHGDLAVVGAWLAAFPAAGGFADREAYIFERVGGTWVERQRVAAPPSYSNGFTASAGISTDGQRIAIGGSRELLNGNPVGAVYVYQNLGGTWQQTATITPSDAPNGGNFGQTVQIEGNRMVVGAPADPVNGLFRAGSVYQFEYAGGAWQEVRKITAPTPAARDFFGVGLALEGRKLLVGAYQSEPQPFTRNGYACLYHINGSELSAPVTITASDGVPHDIFGWRCALSGDRAVITAPFQTLNQGAAYVYTGVSPPCPTDLDDDGSVGLGDLTILLSQYGMTEPLLIGDLDGDGSVGLSDLTILLSQYGTAC